MMVADFLVTCFSELHLSSEEYGNVDETRAVDRSSQVRGLSSQAESKFAGLRAEAATAAHRSKPSRWI